MKTITIHPTPHDEPNLNPSPAADKSAVRHTFTLGLDVDLRTVVVAIQCDQGVIAPGQKFTRAAEQTNRTGKTGKGKNLKPRHICRCQPS
jgi:hypothetical protein